MWKKKLKFGYIKGTCSYNDGRKNIPYIFEVFITIETEDTYEIRYGENMIDKYYTSHRINGLSKVVSKDEIYGIHEKELNLFQRWGIYDRF